MFALVRKEQGTVANHDRVVDFSIEISSTL